MRQGLFLAKQAAHHPQQRAPKATALSMMHTLGRCLHTLNGAVRQVAVLVRFNLPTAAKRVVALGRFAIDFGRRACAMPPDPLASSSTSPMSNLAISQQQPSTSLVEERQNGCGARRSMRALKRVDAYAARAWLGSLPTHVARRVAECNADREIRAARLLGIHQNVRADLRTGIPHEVTRVFLAHVPLWWAIPHTHAELLLREIARARKLNVVPADFRAVSQWLMRGQLGLADHDLTWAEARRLALADRSANVS
jgi:hypothetical protein